MKWVSLVVQLVKNPLQCGRPGFDPWVGKIPWRREWLPTPVFWPREFHGLYSPWGCNESDMTEQLTCVILKPNGTDAHHKQPVCHPDENQLAVGPFSSVTVSVESWCRVTLAQETQWWFIPHMYLNSLDSTWGHITEHDLSLNKLHESKLSPSKIAILVLNKA